MISIKKVPCLVGLKSCNELEIKNLMGAISSMRYKVSHKTKHKSGKKLPYNGVLSVERR